MVSGRAAQFTLMNGLPARALPWWTAKATSSLPTPLSPRTSTVASLGATWPIKSNTTCIALEFPTMLSGWKRSSSSCLSRLTSSSNRCRSSCALRRRRTAWATIELMIESSRTSSCSGNGASKRRSALSAPIDRLPMRIGTQKTDTSLRRTCRGAPPGRSRNSGSLAPWRTTAARPAAITLPTVPSPAGFGAFPERPSEKP